jgi:RHS repeat-associated protein
MTLVAPRSRKISKRHNKNSVDSQWSVSYTYGQDGERTAKYGVQSARTVSETLYFNKMWNWHFAQSMEDSAGRYSKHIYLDDTRVVTKIAKNNANLNTSTQEETAKQYYYHSDHLGSAQLISDAQGREYERLEYTPYGEIWIDKSQAASEIDVPFRFTGKERDVETGLYYYGARYLDSKTSRWLSTDPALGEYIPGAPINDEAKKRNGNLPGMGGVFNVVNFHLYHYAGNNPVKYIDPDGRDIFPSIYDQYCANIILGGVEMTKAAIGDVAGRIGNFFSNISQGDFEAKLSMGVKFTALPGLGGTAQYTTDGKSGSLNISTTIDTTSGALETLMGLSGSPVTITSEGITVGVGVASVTVTDDIATVSIELKAGLSDNINVNAGLSVTASTQNGPYGTIQNGQGATGASARAANYLLGSGSVNDLLNQ